MTSLRGRLSRVLFILLGGVCLQWLIADRTRVYVVESEMESRLRHDADTLIATLELSDEGLPASGSGSPGTIYSRPYSGHYYTLATEGRRLQSASFGGTPPFAVPAVATDSLDHVVGPRAQPLLVLTTHATVSGRPVVLSVGEDLSPMRQELARFRLVFLLVSLAIVAGAMALQQRELRSALRPLDRLRGAVHELRQHGTPIEAAGAPAEIAPLVDEINRLLTFVGRRLEQSRTAIGNLSHAVKTPLAAVVRLLDDPRIREHPDLRQQLQEQAEAVRTRIQRELKRARLAGDTPTTATFNPSADLPALVKVMTQIHGAKPLDVTWSAPEGELPFDRQDMVELIGNLADNACTWARRQVRIAIDRAGDLRVVVSDDGPGCSAEEMTRLGSRGQRVDESVAGSGLGLAIAKEIAESAGGRLELSRSASLGGLEVAARFSSPRA